MTKSSFRVAIIIMIIIYLFRLYIDKDKGLYQVIDKYSVLNTKTGTIYKNGDAYNPINEYIDNAYEEIDEERLLEESKNPKN